jgi:hypothetical protein
MGQQVLEPLLGINAETGILECGDRSSLHDVKGQQANTGQRGGSSDTDMDQSTLVEISIEMPDGHCSRYSSEDNYLCM